MSGFNDVIDQALPYLARERIEATSGTTWSWGYLIADNDGALVDMTSGYTGTLSIRTASDGSGSEVIAPTVTFPSAGQVKCTAAPTATGALTPGSYFHELTITRTSDSAKVVVVGAGDSKFRIKKKVS